MELYVALVVILTYLACLFCIIHHLTQLPFVSKLKPRENHRLPPGPKPLPIIGNILEMGRKPHRAFARLAQIHGPLVLLRLGSVTTVVVSSADVAKEMFLKNDHQFSSSRTVPNSVTAGDHHKLTMSWLPVSPKWRYFRKITAVHLLSPQRLDACSSLRQAKVQQLYQYVLECSRTGCAVDIGKAAFTMSLNFLSVLFFSIELAHHNSSKSQEFRDLIWNLMEDTGKPNYADYFPLLRHIDPSGIRKRLAANFERLIAVFQGLIAERMSRTTEPNSDTNDMLDALLQLYKRNELSMDEINHLLVDIFGAGTDTTSSTIEWAMAELVRNPHIMERAQAEIGHLVHEKDLPIQEHDILKLPYLQAIINETFRLHPPTVFLLPRKATTDVELYGCVVPRDAQILVNLWSIGRDSTTWENPNEFNPNRFINHEISAKGRDFCLLPFGAGKRICPGMNLAYRMLTLMLATLLHSFDWKLGDGMSLKDFDMDEKFGITLQKTKPLEIIPIAKYS